MYAKTDIPPLIDSKLRSNLINLHKSGKFADIRLKIGDAVIPAHKCILASRSLKFKMLFESQMLDSPSPQKPKSCKKICSNPQSPTQSAGLKNIKLHSIGLLAMEQVSSPISP